MKIIIITTLVLLFIVTSLLNSQYKNLIKANTKYGINSIHQVFIDTTDFQANLISLEINKRLYSKEGFYLLVNQDIYNKQYDSLGKPIIEQIVTLDYLKPNYIEEYSNKFALIKAKFGEFTIKYYPPINRNRKEIRENIIKWDINFDSLINAKEFIDFFRNDLKLLCGIDFESKFPITIPNERSIQGWTTATDIQTDLPDIFYENNFHKRGYAWNIYSLKLPMAWEICSGNDSVVVSVFDCFDPTANDPHPDLPINQSLGDNGNWLVLNNNSGYFDGIQRWTYFPSYDLTSGWRPTDHGITVLSMAISKMNNDNLQSSPIGGHIGTCPDCRGLAFYFNQLTTPSHSWMLYDTDLQNNGIIEPSFCIKL